MKTIAMCILLIMCVGCGQENTLSTYERFTKIGQELELCVSDLSLPYKTSPSKYNKNLRIINHNKMRCPSGEEIIFEPEHGEVYECGGNRFVNYGNSIWILPNN